MLQLKILAYHVLKIVKIAIVLDVKNVKMDILDINIGMDLFK
jgi:hypothetical protein